MLLSGCQDPFTDKPTTFYRVFIGPTSVMTSTVSFSRDRQEKLCAKNLNLLFLFVYSPSNEHQSVMIVVPNSKWQVTFVEHAILS